MTFALKKLPQKYDIFLFATVHKKKGIFTLFYGPTDYQNHQIVDRLGIKFHNYILIFQ